MKLFKDRLREITEGYGSSRAFARMLGVSDTAVGRWLKGGDVTLSNLNNISEKCGVEVKWLATGEGPKFSGADVFGAFSLIPRYDVRASAGFGEEVTEEDIVEEVPFNTSWLHGRYLQPNKLAMIQVSGDSMEPTLENRDFILFDKSDQNLRDGMLYVLNLNGTLLVKRLLTMFDGSVVIRSDNSAYADQQVTPEHASRLAVLGRVVWFSRNM
ncbi:MAG: hypothetical protein CSA81_07760 [Acidobacteria bacterium]|nr:MAG: hypothetical protein CSA81_07760 [Acidobacteriota bacterium]